ncbi:hypothetical protein TrLO_g11074 [Triparma laevis f. longispina]|uniref:proton-translocating NAD(P)(+) transhydrogenase n=1 Tax=Triparma laevis f. longispina TaxID=1714387 RepID=A0A9W7KVP0_9STRA|nr:hypothetical protein TrLO_g11074 [Triparma laevis f. longispina]
MVRSIALLLLITAASVRAFLPSLPVLKSSLRHSSSLRVLAPEPTSAANDEATPTTPLGLPYTSLTIGVLSDSDYSPFESRVALTPETMAVLVEKGFKCVVQSGAGISNDNIAFPDESYERVGCSIVKTDSELISASSVIAKIRPPTASQISELSSDKILLSQISPSLNPEIMEPLTKSGATVFDLTSVPRMLSRAQAFDTLSSQANIAGYRSVVEASTVFGRFFSGQMTAAGKVPPAKVLVLGVGVAGLAAIQTARNMGSIVRAFDVRPVTKEQVESMGAEFLTVDYVEDGSGDGGYAKEMSDGFKAAQAAMMLEQAGDVDIIITTALIPGRKAPILVTEEMLNAMKTGSVIVDLAAANGGNVEASVPDSVITTSKGVTIVGFTDLPSRLPATSSNLFSNNIKNFLLSIGPQTTKNKGYFHIDTSDEAVDNMMIIKDGKDRRDDMTPYSPPAPKAVTEVSTLTPEEIQAEEAARHKDEFVQTIVYGSVAALALTLVGAKGGASTLLGSFALAGLAGQQVVWGVAPALHSPLMAVTNAISGLTAVGGMSLLAHSQADSIIPNSGAGWAGAVALTLSCVNIVGGFTVSGKMLDLFRRPEDPEEFFELYLVPFGVMVSGLALSAAGVFGDLEGTTSVTGIAGAICCISAIAALAKQETARAGNAIGIAGVGLGVASTVGDMTLAGANLAAFEQTALFAAGGATIGGTLAKGVGPSQLPETVAGFHSLVGLAAMLGAIGEYLSNSGSLDTGILACVYAATWVGGITFTGSIIAYLKLAQVLGSAPLILPGKDAINLSALAVSAAGLAAFLDPTLAASVSSDPETVRLAALAMVSLVSSGLGLSLVSSIGGADMPVVITVLNSYSGWALVAEGFMLQQPLLSEVGALIGFSGAILTWIMCQAMNRSVINVILGGAPASSAPEGEAKVYDGEVTTANLDALVESVKEAESIIIVPGYGLAVAQAQFTLASVVAKLVKMKKRVRFAIHPVAGRMPGQLNVLLAEAGVPYDIVEELEEINDDFESTDVALVIGASDTVNKGAEEDENCSIYGMPVLGVWKAKKTFVIKRKLDSVGYAGLVNPTLYDEGVDVVLGDAKDVCEAVNAAL